MGDASEPRSRYGVLVVACLTLGLAPFLPEPHIVHKLRWIAVGGEGMGIIDWIDVPFHGAPWALLLATAILDGRRRWVGGGDDESARRAPAWLLTFALVGAAICVALAAR